MTDTTTPEPSGPPHPETGEIAPPETDNMPTEADGPQPEVVTGVEQP